MTLVLAVAGVAPLVGMAGMAAGQVRVQGVDVSEYQGTINWTSVKNSGRSFAFIRATRGGTTGSSSGGGLNTIGLGRYDDPRFYTNISGAKAAGMYTSAYHYSRADIIPPGYPDTSTGLDEANHFLERAGAYVKPGYLLPVLDLEEGGPERTSTDLSNWATSYADRIKAVTGVYPIVYMNSSYANSQLNSTVPAKMPNLWIARWDANSNPETGNPIPSGSLTDVDGIWPNWMFWQWYVAPNGTVPGINAAIDLDAGHGTIEWLKDFLVPAYWTANGSGTWGASTNWNSHNAGYNGTTSSGPPSRVPGNVSGTPNLSGIDDTVILDNTMTAAAYTVTLDAGSYNVRKLYVKRPLNVTGGSLTINYDPTTAAAIGAAPTVLGSTTFSAQFSEAVSVSGGALSVHTLLVDNTRTFTLSGGALTLNKVQLTAGATPAKMLINGDVTLNPLANAAAIITSNTTTDSGNVDLGGGTRTLTIGNGAADVDVTLNVPVSNGTIVKAGAGTLQLNKAATFNGPVTVSAGTLIATMNNQLGTVVSVGTGGSLQLSGNLSYGVPLTLSGAGASGVTGSTAPGKPGALHVPAGNVTWSGPVSLAGIGSTSFDPATNTVSAAGGATLTLSGQISPGIAGATAALAKADNGTVVLTGSQPNTYTGVTRVYGGTLVVEKDGALGTATNHTYMLANSAGTIAFRAPASSPGGFTYSGQEFLMTEGSGNAGQAQVVNLSGDNTFAGSIAVGGPGGVGSIGVSGGSLTVGGGLYAYSGVPAARTINKVGPGTLVLAGSNITQPAGGASFLTNSTLNVSSGTVDLRSPDFNVFGVTTHNVSAGATLLNSAGTIADAAVSVAGTFRQAGGRMDGVGLGVVSGGAAVLEASGVAPSVLASLVIGGTGTLDITSNDLFIDYEGASPADGVRQYLLNGRLVSSTAAADAQGRLGIGYIEASLLPVQTGGLVDSTALLLQTTWFGDADHDGAVTPGDYALVDRGMAMGLKGWMNGDFNYDDVVDVLDYQLMDRVYHQQAGTMPSATFLAMREAQFGEGYAAALVASIPEPSGMFVACGAWLVAGRRRRRRAV